tara:strand:+ start:1435 stop:2505 length:1071 start_codon:yes stop_codon:yes gene_type:complete
MEFGNWFYESWDDIFKILTFIGSAVLVLSPIYIFEKYYLSENLPKKIASESESDIYIKNAKKQFSEIFEEHSFHAKYNSNVSPLFYKPEELEKELIISKNELENRWNNNILIEDTPDGNVVMYYDVYKQTFSYTCDKQLSFKMITAVAIKYILEFRCIDFFVDMTILPPDYKSPITIAMEEYDKRELEKKREKRRKMGIDFEGAPFIKKKSTIIEETSDKNSRTTSDVVYKNAFQYKGRLSTIAFLQKQVEKDHDNEFGTPVDLSTIDETSSDKTVKYNLNAVQIEKEEEEKEKEEEEEKEEEKEEEEGEEEIHYSQGNQTTKKTKLQKFSSLFTQSVPDTYVEFKRQRELEKKHS